MGANRATGQMLLKLKLFARQFPCHLLSQFCACEREYLCTHACVCACARACIYA